MKLKWSHPEIKGKLQSIVRLQKPFKNGDYLPAFLKKEKIRGFFPDLSVYLSL
jgi:hypothetical protein